MIPAGRIITEALRERRVLDLRLQRLLFMDPVTRQWNKRPALWALDGGLHLELCQYPIGFRCSCARWVRSVEDVDWWA